jgi:hypothetical protein
MQLAVAMNEKDVVRILLPDGKPREETAMHNPAVPDEQAAAPGE